jgi:DMSO/TMAO reductase YedYZ molybdopterin-dependent catalytic subunit
VAALFGALVGAGVAAVVAGLDRSGTTSPLFNWLWLLAAFAAWGLAHGWAYSALAPVEAVSPEVAAAPAIEPRNTLAASGPQMSALNRRQFLITLGGASATVTLVGAGLSALLYSPASDATSEVAQAPLELGPMPTMRSEEGLVLPAPGTRAEITPLEEHYRIDINSGSPPRLEAETYRLALTGLLENPSELTLDEVRALGEPMHQIITMSCISNPVGGDLISTTLWTGISMQSLLDFAQPDPAATHLRITSTDGFYETLALDVIHADPRVMLTYAFDGQPLPVRNGFPLRIHIPDHYGMKQPKWITGMEFVSEWQPGYWVDRGWDREARVRATSVIDTVAVDSIEQRDGQSYVPVGGIAWAGVRGISAVQVKVDEGTWVDAQLREPVSDKSWVIWRYDWPFEPGNHNFSVRCAEKDGTPQIEAMEGTRPSGATGIHLRNVDVPDM